MPQTFPGVQSKSVWQPGWPGPQIPGHVQPGGGWPQVALAQAAVQSHRPQSELTLPQFPGASEAVAQTGGQQTLDPGAMPKRPLFAVPQTSPFTHCAFVVHGLGSFVQRPHVLVGVPHSCAISAVSQRGSQQTLALA